MTMDQPGEFLSGPFDFSKGGVLTVEAGVLPPGSPSVVEFALEGSEDRTTWAELVAGAVTAGESVAVPCRGRMSTWGRVRLRSFGGNARVSMRGFRAGDR